MGEENTSVTLPIPLGRFAASNLLHARLFGQSNELCKSCQHELQTMLSRCRWDRIACTSSYTFQMLTSKEVVPLVLHVPDSVAQDDLHVVVGQLSGFIGDTFTNVVASSSKQFRCTRCVSSFDTMNSLLRHGAIRMYYIHLTDLSF